MNDKCCMTCDYKNKYGDCPFNFLVTTGIERIDRYVPEGWDEKRRSCDCYSPLPDKPGKIEPLKGLVNSLDLTPIIYKINELIAAHNGRDGR